MGVGRKQKTGVKNCCCSEDYSQRELRFRRCVMVGSSSFFLRVRTVVFSSTPRNLTARPRSRAWSFRVAVSCRTLSSVSAIIWSLSRCFCSRRARLRSETMVFVDRLCVCLAGVLREAWICGNGSTIHNQERCLDFIASDARVLCKPVVNRKPEYTYNEYVLLSIRARALSPRASTWAVPRAGVGTTRAVGPAVGGYRAAREAQADMLSRRPLGHAPRSGLLAMRVRHAHV